MSSLWRLYEIAAIEHLLVKGESTSVEVWEGIYWASPISRASVINFLNRLVEIGLSTSRSEPSRGGHKKFYTLVVSTMDDFNEVVIEKILYKLWEIFPQNEKMAEVIKI